MRFKVDENLPTEVAGLLRKSGHDAMTVGEQHLGGALHLRLASAQGEDATLGDKARAALAFAPNRR